MAKKGLTSVKEEKTPKKARLINELKDKLGWVSFNTYQLEQLGINPLKHTTTDLRKLVFERLEIEARKPKVKSEGKKE